MLAFGLLAGAGCHRRQPTTAPAPPVAKAPAKPARAAIPARKPVEALAAGETYIYENGTARREKIEAARAAGYLDVDLSDGWAPFILQDGDGPDAKPNAYRETFAKLANEELDADGDPPRPGEHNYLEVFGIPPTLSVLAARAEAAVAPAYEDCVDAVDRQALEQWSGDVIYLDRDRARREFDQAQQDAAWLDKSIAAVASPIPLARDKAVEQVRADPKLRGRVDRYARGQARVRAVRALQARMLCEGLLTARSRYTPGVYDLPSHEALANWERKHDIFGWGFLGGETLGMLLRPPRPLALEAFKRLLAERVPRNVREARQRRAGRRRRSAANGGAQLPRGVRDPAHALGAGGARRGGRRPRLRGLRRRRRPAGPGTVVRRRHLP